MPTGFVRVVFAMLITMNFGCEDTFELEPASTDRVPEELAQLQQVRNEYPLKQNSAPAESEPAKSRQETHSG
jgi:hypothetical protein